MLIFRLENRQESIMYSIFTHSFASILATTSQIATKIQGSGKFIKDIFMYKVRITYAMFVRLKQFSLLNDGGNQIHNTFR
jgi:hypothetical protein